MASFLPAAQKVLSLEGGYQNHPEDLGNYNAYDANGNYVTYLDRKGQTLRAGTNRGVSAGLLSGIKGREVSVQEMKDISKQDALQIYQQYFWNAIQGDKIPHQQLAELIFDSKVNHGNKGVIIVQEVLNKVFGKNLVPDGVVGPLTLAAIKSVSPAKLHDQILKARTAFYHQLVEVRPDNKIFLQGWLNRLKKFPLLTTATNPIGIAIVLLLIAISILSKPTATA